ncbi:MAG: cation:proton antiporter [Clostridia bacterium]|nr:cation:proton antiporter [Clostridia bacterium]
MDVLMQSLGEASVLLSLAIALVGGLVLSRIVKRFGMPAVTGYLIAGILVGPFCLGALGIDGIGFTSLENAEEYGILSDLALGFIAFAIGNEFRLSELKETGKAAAVIGCFQALTATFVVDAALIGLHFIIGGEMSLPVAITLGAIATATAPAATLMVVKQYKAKGKLTKLLLPIVALDDAVGLIVFAASFGVARALQNGNANMTAIVVEPLIEIFGSLLLGFLMGLLLSYAEKMFTSGSKRLCLAVTAVTFTVALSMLKMEIGGIHVGFSSLLVCMMLGTVFCNVCDFSADIMDRADKWTMPIYILFFVLSGAELDLSILTNGTVVLIGIIYIVTRSIGKYGGAYLSARAMKLDKKVTNNLGITLLPQAGVALGMCMTAAAELGNDGQTIRNIVLFGVLIYELVGPTLTKGALMRAGDITPRPATPHDKDQRQKNK